MPAFVDKLIWYCSQHSGLYYFDVNIQWFMSANRQETPSTASLIPGPTVRGNGKAVSNNPPYPHSHFKLHSANSVYYSVKQCLVVPLSSCYSDARSSGDSLTTSRMDHLQATRLYGCREATPMWDWHTTWRCSTRWRIHTPVSKGAHGEVDADIIAIRYLFISLVL